MSYTDKIRSFVYLIIIKVYHPHREMKIREFSPSENYLELKQ